MVVVVVHIDVVLHCWIAVGAVVVVLIVVGGCCTTQDREGGNMRTKSSLIELITQPLLARGKVCLYANIGAFCRGRVVTLNSSKN